MAQHISLLHSKITEIKGFQKAKISLCKKAELGICAIAGSLKFEEIKCQEHKINPNDRIFVTHRVVNKNTERFELHYDTKEKKLIDIFFVS